MEPAIKKIADAYLRLGNRRAIEDLLMHRRRLLIDLSGRVKNYDVSRPTEQISEEIRILEEALQTLGPKTVPPRPVLATLPDLAAS